MSDAPAPATGGSLLSSAAPVAPTAPAVPTTPTAPVAPATSSSTTAAAPVTTVSEAQAYELYTKDGKPSDSLLKAIPEDYNDVRAFFQKYKDPKALAEGVRGLNTVAGRKALVPPAADAKPEEKAAYDKAVRQALGVPETADAYKFEKPTDLPEGMTWSDEQAASFGKLAHELAIPPATANKLVAFQTELAKQQMQAAEAAQVQSRNEAVASLRKDFGEALEKTVLPQAAAFAKKIGLDVNDPIFNSAAGVKLAYEAAQLMGESALVPGSALNESVSLQQQARDLGTKAMEAQKRGDMATYEELCRRQTAVFTQLNKKK